MTFFLFIIFPSCLIFTLHATEKNGILNEMMVLDVKNSSQVVVTYSYIQEEDFYLRAKVNASLFGSDRVMIILNENENHVDYMELSNDKGVEAERMICRSNINQTGKWKSLKVYVSTSSPNDTKVCLEVVTTYDFQLKEYEIKNFSVGFMSPVYWSYTFNESYENVVVVVNSTDDTCMILSIQGAKCPINDDPESVTFKGSYETVTSNGSITVNNNAMSGRFFLVFVLVSNSTCGIPDNAVGKSSRGKFVSVLIKEIPNRKDYVLPIFFVIGFYGCFYVVALFISLIVDRYKKSKVSIEIEVESLKHSIMSDLANPTTIEVADMGTIYSRRYGTNYQTFVGHPGTSRSLPVLNAEEDDFDHVPELWTNPDIYRLNTTLFVSHLSMKPAPVMSRKFFLYFWYLVIISVFYSLPVVQLVIRYQLTFNTTGNQDMCYYNFRCTRPLYIFTAFNNIYSNIGYVLLGILFILITWRRHMVYEEYKTECKHKKKHGVPQYYGLFYAMGLALSMEGVMSACYHVCPSNLNFQFDTSYMYIIACLCMIKIYQTRHPDVNASAHSFFMIIALIIFVGVIGVVYHKLTFWICFPILYVVFYIVVSVEIYYVGRWRLDFGLPKRLYFLIKNDKWMVFMPTYRKRFGILIVMNIINFAFALCGAIWYGKSEEPNNNKSKFGTYFLFVFMLNLFIYFFFYIVMKLKSRERFYVLSVIYTFIAAMFWGFAIYCFINHPTEWALSPAQSRTENQECIFLKFYDIHDVWHLLSSVSLFFSFMALLTIDDGIAESERDQISVF